MSNEQTNNSLRCTMLIVHLSVWWKVSINYGMTTLNSNILLFYSIIIPYLYLYLINIGIERSLSSFAVSFCLLMIKRAFPRSWKSFLIASALYNSLCFLDFSFVFVFPLIYDVECQIRCVCFASWFKNLIFVPEYNQFLAVVDAL